MPVPRSNICCGLLDSPILYLSRYIIRRKPQCYELLQRLRTEAAWVPWTEFMITAVEETSRLTMDLTQAIVSLVEQTTDMARQNLPRITYSRELIELLYVQPYVETENLVNHGIAERRTASKYLTQLEEIGIPIDAIDGRIIGRLPHMQWMYLRSIEGQTFDR